MKKGDTITLDDGTTAVILWHKDMGTPNPYHLLGAENDPRVHVDFVASKINAAGEALPVDPSVPEKQP